MNMKAPSGWIVTQLRWLAGCGLCLFFVTTFVTAQAAAQTGAPTLDEQEMVRLVNQERAQRGLATLVVDMRLTEAARLHSRLMANTGLVEHLIGNEPKLSLRLRAVRSDSEGENVAYSQTVPRAHDGLMHSPGHRANILDGGYNAIGVGIVHTAQGIYITEDFAHRLPEVSVDGAEDQVAAAFNQLRLGTGLHALPRLSAPALRLRACGMAASDHLDPHAGLWRDDVQASVTFTVSDLTQLPDSLQRMKTAQARGFSVGACYQASRTYVNPVFWFIFVTYK